MGQVPGHDAVGADAHSHGIVERPRAGEDAGAVGRVDPTAQEPLGPGLRQDALEAGELGGGEGIPGAPRRADVGHDAREPQVAGGADEPQEVRGALRQHPQATHAGVDVQVDPGDAAQLESQFLESPTAIAGVDADVDVVAQGLGGLLVQQRAQEQDGDAYARSPQLQGFGRGAHAQGRDAAAHGVVGHRDGPVPVGVGLDDQHGGHPGTGQLADHVQIVGQGIEIDVGPDSAAVHAHKILQLGRPSHSPGGGGGAHRDRTNAAIRGEFRRKRPISGDIGG